MWGYKQVSVVDHPRKRSNGCVLEHIIVAEETLGRYLKDEEVVHHIDGDRSNNTHINLMVFRTQNDHARFHTGTYDVLKPHNGVWYCEANKRYCGGCGVELHPLQHRNKYCSPKCLVEHDTQYKISLRKCDRPDKDTLKSLLIESNFSKVAKTYGVSDNAIRKMV